MHPLGRHLGVSFWVLIMVLAYTAFHYGVLEGIFDVSGSKWRAQLPRGEFARIQQVTKELRSLDRGPIAWGTFLRTNDGKIGLVFHGDHYLTSNRLLALYNDGIVRIVPTVPEWEIAKILRVVRPGDDDYQRVVDAFLRR